MFVAVTKPNLAFMLSLCCMHSLHLVKIENQRFHNLKFNGQMLNLQNDSADHWSETFPGESWLYNWLLSEDI